MTRPDFLAIVSSHILATMWLPLALLAGEVVDTAVPLKFVRGGKVHTTEVTVSARP